MLLFSKTTDGKQWTLFFFFFFFFLSLSLSLLHTHTYIQAQFLYNNRGSKENTHLSPGASVSTAAGFQKVFDGRPPS